MFFDRNILTIINNAQDDLNLQDKIYEDYQQAIMQLSLGILKVYLSDKRLPKKSLKAYTDLTEGDPTTIPAIEMSKRLNNALLAASTEEIFQKLLGRAINKFNEDLLDEKVPQLDEDSRTELEDYLKELETNADNNEKQFGEMIEKNEADLEKQIADEEATETGPTEEVAEQPVTTSKPAAAVEPSTPVTPSAEVTHEPVVEKVESAPVSPEPIVLEKLESAAVTDEPIVTKPTESSLEGSLPKEVPTETSTQAVPVTPAPVQNPAAPVVPPGKGSPISFQR